MRPVSDLMNKFNNMEKAVSVLVKDQINEMAKQAKQNLANEAGAKCHDGGGGYIKSIVLGNATVKGKHVKATLTITHPAAFYIEYGTGLYATKGSKGKIVARAVKALAFVVKGEQVVVKSEKGQQAKFIYRDATAKFKHIWYVGGQVLTSRLRGVLNG